MENSHVREATRSPTPPESDRHSTSGKMFYFCGDILLDTMQGSFNFKSLIASTVEQIYLQGSKSVGLVAMAGVAVGAVMTIQFANGLQRFGGTLYIPELVGISVFRELGPILTSLLLAGRIGSGITAELASMNVSEQIDAIRALGDSPQTTLVLPRLLACLVAFPILALFGDAISIMSAMLVSYTDLAFSPSLYLSKTLQTLTAADLWSGILKTIIFGFFIALTACWRGLSTTGGTRGVGESTTWIVVRSSIFILIADFFLSKIFILTIYKHG